MPRESPVSVIRPPAAALSASAMPKSATIGRPSCEEDVLGLDVAVNDALAMGVVQRVGHVGGDPHRLVDAELGLAVELVAEGLAVDERHDVEEEAVGASPESNSGRMCGCCSAAVVVISWTNRSAPRTAASSGLRTLMATLRLCLRSSAR